MFQQDLMIILQWWVVWFLVGMGSFPLTNRWLNRLWDGGYIFAKVVGLVVVGYGVWLGASLHIWEFNEWVVGLGFGIWGVINARYFWFCKAELLETAKKKWRQWLKMEMVFLVATGLWSVIRGFQPDINGLEKFMDYGFMRSILQSRTFPPNDMWFAGGSINYYYFGHYLSAVMTMISGIKPQMTYNLMIATLFGLSVSEAFVLGASIRDSFASRINTPLLAAARAPLERGMGRWVIVAGMLTVMLLVTRGNWHTGGYYVNKWFGETAAMKMVHGQPTTMGDKKDFDCRTGVNWLPCPDNAYWYPDATRYIPFTIHEFPIYSYVVADLHAHLINLPIVLLFIAGLVVLVRKSRQETGDRRQETTHNSQLTAAELETRNLKPETISLWEVGILGGLLGVFAMTNAWDLPIYGLVLVVTMLILAINRGGWGDRLMVRVWLVGMWLVGWLWLLSRCLIGIKMEEGGSAGTLMKLVVMNPMVWLLVVIGGVGGWLIWSKLEMNREDYVKLGKTVLRVGLVGVGAGVLAILVSLPFQLNFEQIAEGIAKVNTISEISKLVVLWGWDGFLFLSLAGFVIFQVSGRNSNIENQNPKQSINSKFEIRNSDLSIWDWVILGWYGVGWLLIVIPELIYVKDIYIADYHRANTMFKLVYQSWTLFAIAGGYTIVRLAREVLSHGTNGTYKTYIKWGWLGLMIVGLVAVGSYAKFAVTGYYGDLSIYRGLNGESWLKMRHPDDYAGIEWLREETKKQRNKETNEQMVVLEATGDSYTEYNRVSAYTGLPTVEGWLVHEWLWRGSFDEPGARGRAVEHIYTATSLDEKRVYSNLNLNEKDKEYSVKELLDKYEVKYIFVGDKEREKYPALNEEKFGEIGEVVFESGETSIYKINL